jgi:glucose/arabinose dehydrogenase
MTGKRLMILAAILGGLIAGDAAAQRLNHAVTYRNFFGTMTFNRPLAFLPYPGEDSVYAVIEQVGKIRTVERRNGAWAKTDSAVLQVPVVSSTGGGKCLTAQSRAISPGITTGYYESRGLLGAAFHPNFRANRKYYVSYVTVQDSSGATHERTIVAERVADSTLRPKTADAERILINFCQPGWDHKGGHIEFGHDGMLYYTSGDGGNQELWSSASNPSLQRNSWLGKVIRIDVNGTPDPGKPYKVPADNPFVDSAGYLPEVWAWGLRNPWKWHFHPTTGDMWLGNVGYTNRDNIYRIPRASYLGWPIWEGNHCSSSNNLSGQCPGTSARVLRPVIDLMHNSEARSVTGGTFFLGNSTAAFHNAYFFGDYIYNWVRVARFNTQGDSVLEYSELNNITNVVSFDRDNQGRIFATSLGTGGVTANSGVVYLLESQGFTLPPVGLAQSRSSFRPKLQTLALAEIRRNPDRYIMTGPDGGRVTDASHAGFVWVREKGSQLAPQRVLLLP